MPARLRFVLSLLVLGVSSLSSSACTPTPSDTCKRLEDLGAKDPAGFKLSMDKCLARMNEMRERDPDAYQCTARTVYKLSSIDSALLAVSVCDTRMR